MSPAFGVFANLLSNLRHQRRATDTGRQPKHIQRAAVRRPVGGAVRKSVSATTVMAFARVHLHRSRISYCRFCGQHVLRDNDGTWIHASHPTYACRDSSGLVWSTYAEPEVR